MSQARRYMRGSLLIFLGEVVLSAKQLVVLPLFARFFGVVGYGVWSQVNVIVALLSPLAQMGLPTAALRRSAGMPREEVARWFSVVLLVTAGACVLLGAGVWPLAPWVAEKFFGGAHNTVFVRLCIPMLLITVAVGVVRSFFLILEFSGNYSMMRMAEGLVILAPLAVVLSLKLQLVSLVIGNVLAFGAVFAWFLAKLVKEIGWQRPDWSLLWPLLRFGVAIIPTSYAMWGLHAADKLFIAAYLDMKQLGAYAAAYAIAYSLVPLFIAPFWALYPTKITALYGEGNDVGMNLLFRQTGRFMTLLMVPSLVGLGLLGRPVLQVLTGPDFVHAGPLITWIGLGYLINTFTGMVGQNFLLVDKPIYQTGTIVAAAGLNIGLNVWWIPRYGITGAAAATVVSFTVELVMVVALSSRLTGIRLRPDWAALAKAVAAGAVMGAWVWWLGTVVASPLVLLLVAVPTGGLVYGVLVMALRFFGKGELVMFLSLLRLERLTQTAAFARFTARLPD